ARSFVPAAEYGTARPAAARRSVSTPPPPPRGDDARPVPSRCARSASGSARRTIGHLFASLVPCVPCSRSDERIRSGLVPHPAFMQNPQRRIMRVSVSIFIMIAGLAGIGHGLAQETPRSGEAGEEQPPQSSRMLPGQRLPHWISKAGKAYERQDVEGW